MANPLVSVCVPTYNRAALLRQTLSTICRQDYSPMEILISDNGSEDETESVCREIAQSDARVRYVRQPRNIGLLQNFNFCIGESRGEFLCIWSDDDQYDPTITSRYAAFLRAHPEVGIVCSDWELIDEDGARLGVREPVVPCVTSGIEYIERTIRSGRSCINTPGTMIRRAALGNTRFEEREPIGFADFVVWFRIAEAWAVGHIRGRLWQYRLHRRSWSRRTVQSIVDHYRKHLMEYCDAHLDRWPEHASMVGRWRKYVDRYLFWALAYEIGLHYRKQFDRSAEQAHYRTTFEMADYHLSHEEFEHVLGGLKAVQTGFDQHTILLAIRALVRLKLTWPLGWVTLYVPVVRPILGLR